MHKITEYIKMQKIKKQIKKGQKTKAVEQRELH